MARPRRTAPPVWPGEFLAYAARGAGNKTSPPAGEWRGSFHSAGARAESPSGKQIHLQSGDSPAQVPLLKASLRLQLGLDSDTPGPPPGSTMEGWDASLVDYPDHRSHRTGSATNETPPMPAAATVPRNERYGRRPTPRGNSRASAGGSTPFPGAGRAALTSAPLLPRARK